MKTCKTCAMRDSDGYCTSEKLTEDYGIKDSDALVYSYHEGGSFWVGPDFGCVHHTEVKHDAK